MARNKKRTDGRVVITKTYDGKRKFFYGATNAEAERKREEFEQQQEKQVYNSDILYDEWLDAWLEYIKNNISPATYKNYSSIINKHLRPELGTHRLSDMNAPILRDFIINKRNLGLSARSVEYIHTLLKASLRLAVDDDLLLKNPMDKIKKPKKEPRREVVALSEVQAKTFLDKIKNLEHKRIFHVAIATGMRRSELLGLRWSDIDYKNQTVTIEQTVIRVGTQTTISQTTKNKTSKRTIHIDSTTTALLKTQRMLVLENQLKTLGYNDNNLVFPNANGTPRNPEQISRIASRYGKLAAVPDGFTFHSLRHTHATLLLKAGVHFKIVQNRLGHATFQQTMDTYSHISPELDKSAVEKIKMFL